MIIPQRVATKTTKNENASLPHLQAQTEFNIEVGVLFNTHLQQDVVCPNSHPFCSVSIEEGIQKWKRSSFSFFEAKMGSSFQISLHLCLKNGLFPLFRFIEDIYLRL